MKDQLIKAMRRNKIVDIMYIAKEGVITKRRIKIIKVVGESIQAYCFTRHAKRLFKIENILAAYPVINKVSGLNA